MNVAVILKLLTPDPENYLVQKSVKRKRICIRVSLKKDEILVNLIQHTNIVQHTT